MVATSFWETFFLFLIFLPLAMVWAFALVDIFRRDDIGGGWKAFWVAVVILLPFFGTLMYLVLRPSGATEEERVAMDQASREFVARYTPPEYSPPEGAAQLRTLADLYDRGKLTDEEFAAEKARVLATGASAAT